MVCRERTFTVLLIRIYTKALWCAERGLLQYSLQGYTPGHYGVQREDFCCTPYKDIHQGTMVCRDRIFTVLLIRIYIGHYGVQREDFYCTPYKDIHEGDMVCRGRTFTVLLIRIYTMALWCAEVGLLLYSL